LGLVRDLLALLVLGAYLHDNSGFGVEVFHFRLAIAQLLLPRLILLSFCGSCKSDLVLLPPCLVS